MSRQKKGPRPPKDGHLAARERQPRPAYKRAEPKEGHSHSCSCETCCSDHHHTDEHHDEGQAKCRQAAQEIVEVDSSEKFINKHGGRGAALTFPCHFPIKIFGYAADDFLAHAHRLVAKHAPELRIESCRSRPSGEGRFLSVTVDIEAQSKEQLDKIYADLKADERIVAML